MGESLAGAIKRRGKVSPVRAPPASRAAPARSPRARATRSSAYAESKNSAPLNRRSGFVPEMPENPGAHADVP
jgi:hypothetical protein